MFAHIPRWLRLAVYIQLSLVVAIPLGGWILQRAGESSDMRRFPPPGQMVDLGSYRTHIYCEGNAPGPVIVYNADISDNSLIWRKVQNQTAAFARSCAIDRAGMGWSELGDKDRSITAVARELSATLDAAGETGPYILVGHGLGALQMAAFAGAFPDKTAGLVLVDPMPPVCLKDRFDAIVARVGASAQSNVRDKLDEIVKERGDCPDGEGGTDMLSWLARIGMVRALAGRNFDPTSPSKDLLDAHRALKLRTQFADATILESKTAYVGMADAREALRTLGAKPVSVIAKGRMGNFPDDQDFLEKRSDNNTLAFEKAQLTYLQEAQKEMVTDLPNGHYTIAGKSAHYIELIQPELVAEAVRQVRDEAQPATAAPAGQGVAN